jgi:hypothetical protein
MKINTSEVPANIREQLEAMGRNWAAGEFGVAQEQGSRRRKWAQYTWCGGTNQLDAIRDDSDEFHSNRDLVEAILDRAAAAEWERLWDEREAFACSVAGGQLR